MSAFERREDVGRQRRIEVIRDAKVSSIGAKHGRRPTRLMGHQPGDRFTGARDEHFPPPLHLCHQLREVRLGFVNVYGLHAFECGLSSGLRQGRGYGERAPA